MKLSGQSQAELVKIGAIALLGIAALWYIKNRATAAAGAMGDMVDRVMDAANTSAALTSDVFTVDASGGADWFKLPISAMPSPVIIPTLLISNAPRGTFNPASDNNLVYSGVNQIGQRISGDRNWTLGGWIYDITH